MNIQTPIDVFALCSDAAQLKGDLPIALLTRFCEDLSSTEGTLAYCVSGQLDDEQHPILHLEVTGAVSMNCQRCAEPLTHHIAVDNALELVHTEADLDDEEEVLAAIAAGQSVGLEKIVGSTTYDLLNLLEDEIILSLPLVVAHTVCEQTLPTSVGEKVSPFDALRTLKNT